MKKAAPTLTDFVYAPLVSTGKASPGNPTMHDDAKGIPFLSAMATEDLEVGERLAAPSGGGVERFVFIAGGILPLGAPHPDIEALGMKIEGGEAHCADPDGLLFHDVDPAVAEKYKAFITYQPAEGWVGNCTHCGWEKAPSSYIIAENDRALPLQLQEACAGIAKSEVIKIPTGHMPMLSDPKLLAEKVISCLQLQE
ncbi:hypothetical protein BJX99DRAFT_251472 [Aspergillus californicus]